MYVDRPSLKNKLYCLVGEEEKKGNANKWKFAYSDS